MLKLAALILLVTIGISFYLKNQPAPTVPKLPEQNWGPKTAVKDNEGIRPFKINVSKSVIDELNQRLDRTRELQPPLEGAGWTYGISTTFLNSVLKHWRTKYDWSKRQELLNKYPQFKTKIQGLDIHFYHVKPTLPKDRNVRVLPLLLVHGWPGSVVEFQKIFPLLTTPRPDQDYVFEVIAPSLPGYGFSDAAVRPGLGPAQMAVIFKNLMLRLGYDKFYTQGGDWGSVITATLSQQFPNKVSGAHFNMCFSNTASATIWSIIGAYLPSLVATKEEIPRIYPLSHHWLRLVEETGYMHIQATKPDTVGTAVTDSPAGLAAYILEKFSTWTNPEYRFRDDGGLFEKFTIDELLDNLMVYWVTNSITTSFRLYAETFNKSYKALGFDELPVPVSTGCAIFPHELAFQPESIIRSKYPNTIQYSVLPRGGHFAAFEEPQLLADDVWSFVNLREKQLKVEKTKESQ
ncbi:juvenile hormone epoxide hydrolase 2 [Cephus cinctus]|uniref:Epoxide hydrolase n=1 Tax=Cephus cinctus TaxID=211228 RepID=A0AAJ7BZJ4_CEPCN|nr:juvenile hormone epoxide hydrolase 2 [Cephus cinctus]